MNHNVEFSKAQRLAQHIHATPAERAHARARYLRWLQSPTMSFRLVYRLVIGFKLAESVEASDE